MTDDRVSTLLSRKAMLDTLRHPALEFEKLTTSWAKESQIDSVGLAIYPVRAVSLLEAFVRERVRTIVNHSKVYADRARPLLQNFRSDYSFIIEIAHQTITFGDIVAHAIPVSSLTNIITAFEQLSNRNLPQELSKAIDRWAVEIRGSPPVPIIANFDSNAAAISQIFSLRHRICHEAASLSSIEKNDMSGCLLSVSQFVNATSWFWTELLQGNVPLTQTGMNIEAIGRANEARSDMQAILQELQLLLRNYPRDLRLLAAAQHAWERYESLQSYGAHDPQGGGTIGPLIRANESFVLTQERIQRLKSHIAFSGLWALP